MQRVLSDRDLVMSAEAKEIHVVGEEELAVVRGVAEVRANFVELTPDGIDYHTSVLCFQLLELLLMVEHRVFDD